MPSDRHRRRAVLLATGIVCSTISTGCSTSPSVRRGTEPAPEPVSAASPRGDAQNTIHPGRVDSSVRSASVQATDVPPSAATQATPFAVAPGANSPAPAAEFPLELRAVPDGSTGNAKPSEPGTGAGAAAPPAKTDPAPPASTPLLDAYIQRVAEVTRQQREAIDAGPAPAAEPTDNRKRPQEPVTIVSKESAESKARAPDHRPTDTDAPPLPEHLSAGPQDDHRPAEPITVTPVPTSPLAEPLAAAPAHASLLGGLPNLSPTPDAGAISRSGSSLTPKKSPDVWATPDAGAVPADVASLGIGELRLCRQVFGFGSFEPLASERVKAGQRLLVYCELTGIQYEERGAVFVSRISSRVEVKPGNGGPVLWSRELGDAQDVCRRRRRDYYVNSRVDLPSNLGPGAYRLRLLQTDLVAGSSTSSEIPFEITP
jgi:hypothetical protein